MSENECTEDTLPLSKEVVNKVCKECFESIVKKAKNDTTFYNENPELRRGICTHWGVTNSHEWCINHTTFFIRSQQLFLKASDAQDANNARDN